MNEFIVWDMIINKPVVVATIEDYISVNFKDRCKAFIDIGLKDINGKNIYADSSIVEFTASGSHGYTQIKGYFHFLKEDLKYIIKTFTHGSFDFNKKLYKNFKVIDTIQENKLGLIK